MIKRIPDCYWPGASQGAYVSHEAVCILNEHCAPVRVELTLYFEDREKMEGFWVTVGAERTKHIRLDRLINEGGQPIPRDTPYAIVIKADRDVAIQYTRVDTTQSELAIATTMV